MATTLTHDVPGTVLGTISLSTTEVEVNFRGSAGHPLIEVVGDATWQYRSSSEGTYYPIPAGSPFQINSRTFFADVASGTATLRVLQIG